MYQFSGTGRIFNGRYWREYDVRAKAGNFRVAIARCTASALKQHKAATKSRTIEQIAVSIERLGKVIDPEKIVVDSA